MITNLKKEIPTLNKTLILKNLIHFEKNLRQVFYNGRCAEIEENPKIFNYKGIEIKTALISPIDYEIYDVKTEYPVAKILIYANYEIISGKRKYKHQKLINNQSGCGFIAYLPTTLESDWVMIKKEMEDALNLLGDISYNNWRQMKPMLVEYTQDKSKEKKIVFWSNKQKHKFLVINNFKDIPSIIGTTNGIIRLIYCDKEINLDYKEIGECTVEDISNFLTNGEMYKPILLTEKIENEIEFDKNISIITNLMN